MSPPEHPPPWPDHLTAVHRRLEVSEPKLTHCWHAPCGQLDKHRGALDAAAGHEGRGQIRFRTGRTVCGADRLAPDYGRGC